MSNYIINTYYILYNIIWCVCANISFDFDWFTQEHSHDLSSILHVFGQHEVPASGKWAETIQNPSTGKPPWKSWPGENHAVTSLETRNPWEIWASSRSALWPPQSSVRVTDWSSWMEHGTDELNMKLIWTESLNSRTWTGLFINADDLPDGTYSLNLLVTDLLRLSLINDSKQNWSIESNSHTNPIYHTSPVSWAWRTLPPQKNGGCLILFFSAVIVIVKYSYNYCYNY